MIFIVLLTGFLVSLVTTPFVKRVAFKVGAVDMPNSRKVHDRIIPRLGGLAIILSFALGVLIGKWLGVIEFNNYSYNYGYIMLGILIIVLVGVVDDLIELSAKIKLIGQIISSFIVVVKGGLSIEVINLFLDLQINLGVLSIPVSMFWIIGITNAINLIDGLDGLAGGVSSISLLTISFLAFSNGSVFIGVISVILISSILGFLVYNFYPAKIFMGDAGSLYLGFMLSVISLMEFKNVTFFTLIVPVFIFAVPILDTFFAIIRRIVNKRPIYTPDKMHLHHRLLVMGLSHVRAVIVIYMISLFFSVVAIILSRNIMWSSFMISVISLLIIEIGVEKIGLISKEYKPLLNVFNKLKAVSDRK